MEQKRTLIVLTGPTAVGKSKLSIELARELGGEIISADSCQVYQHMNIGSAKITKEEMGGIPHFLIDILPPQEDFNVAVFQKMAKDCMEDIYSRGHIPILVGGTGFYIQAVLYDINFTENDENKELRNHLEKIVREQGTEYLHEMLREVDEQAAAEIHANNTKRVIRAIEFYQMTGTPISKHNELERKKESPYDSYYFVLTDTRERLYEKINQRVDIMMQQGLLEEVKSLQNMGCTREMVSMQALGYKELLSYLDGELSLEEAVDTIKKSTRHFAKRQLTWFRREKDVIFVPKQDFSYQDDKIVTFLKQTIQGTKSYQK